MPSPEMCQRCAGIVPWFSLWGNLTLAIYKLIVGTIGGSAALVADALHSFADVVGSGCIVVVTKLSGRPVNTTYPYGYGKAEFLGAVFVYTMLLFLGLGISVNAIASMFSPNPRPPHLVTLFGAVVSVFYNYLMFKYATCVGKRNHSPAILADAFENRADAVSSVACIAGILGALLIHPVCDAIAALVVGIVIVYNCQEQLREAGEALMDGGYDEEEVERLRKMIGANPEVLKVAFLKTRRTGARFWVDVGVEVAGDIEVRQADELAASIRQSLNRSPEIHHVEVFILAPESATSSDASSSGQLAV